MRILYVDKVGNFELLNELPPVWQVDAVEKPALLWLDLDGEAEVAAVEQFLTERFGFHPLAIDDALHETHMPKLDDWDAYLYLTLRDINWTADNLSVTLPELDLFLGKTYLVTYHAAPITAVNHVWQHCQQNHRWLQHGADHLLYHLIDAIVDHFTAVLDQLEGELMQLESEIFANPTADLLARLTTYKRIVLQIRRVLAPQREVVGKLARNPYGMIGNKDQVYFRDVYDHMVRLDDMSDNMRELSTSSMEIYLTMVNNRMNDIMKTLTIITTLFMPLTFITGFFGMNFFQAVLPSGWWTGLSMLLITLIAIVLLPFLMFYWMRRRAWM